MIESNDYLFCRVFLDHRGPSNAIDRLIGELTGAPKINGTVVLDGMEITVDHGDNHPPIEERDYSRWINWKYSLEVLFDPDASSEQFAAALRPLLKKLHDANIKAVPACDFEELLSPWNLTNA